MRSEIDTRAALDKLLSGTGLVIRSYDGKTAILDAAEPVANADNDALEQIVSASPWKAPTAIPTTLTSTRPTTWKVGGN